MTTWSDAFSIRTTHDLELVILENSVDAAANTSSVTARLQINPPSDSSSFSLISGDNDYSFTFNGTNYSGNFTFDFRTDRSTQVLRTVTSTISHNTDGTKSVTGSGSSTTVVLGNASISTKTFTLTALPGTPTAAPTLTRSADGGTITVLSATSGTTATVTDYEYRQSADGSAWGSAVSMGTDRTIDVTGLTTTQQYYYQTRVKTADGSGPWSASANVVGVPTAPATITAVRTGRNVAVTAGDATGTGITGYWVQYSTNGGSSWSTAVAMTSQAYTYTSLTAGLTYLFRVYATNAIGNSAYTTSSGVFVPAGGKRWDGSAWNSTSVGKRWDGSAWVDLTIAKRWDGSSWVDLS